MAAPPVLNIHTPTSSFALVHSITQDSLQSLFDKLSRKAHTDYYGERVGPGWLKYEFNDTIWNLDDDSDYTIFVWRQQQQLDVVHLHASPSATASNHSASGSEFSASNHNYEGIKPSTPTLHLHNPAQPLPEPPAYLNAAYYLFRPSGAYHPGSRSHSSSPQLRGSRPGRTKTTGKRARGGTGATGAAGAASGGAGEGSPGLGVGARVTNSSGGGAELSFRRDFEKFHGENGVRTVMGSIGPVQNVRMLLKSGYRHVYISRKFAAKHGFIPSDAMPGQYGYGGLVNIGVWPITVAASLSLSTAPSPIPGQQPIRVGQQNDGSGPPTLKWNGTVKAGKNPKGTKDGPKPTMITVYLSEEPHFDVVLGRSFFEKRQIRTNAADPTDVVCLDTGEKLECELVILKDGRGEIVTVT